MSRKLTIDQWNDIKTRYQLGDAIRVIARDYDIPDSTIHARKNKENWTQKLSAQVSEIKNKITEIEHEIEHAQLPLVTERIQKEISDQLAIIKSIQNLDKGALNLHGIILKKTLSKAQSGELSEREASQIASNMGLSIDKIGARAGLTKEGPTTAIQINNGNTSIELPDNAVDASRAYQEMINGK